MEMSTAALAIEYNVIANKQDVRTRPSSFIAATEVAGALLLDTSGSPMLIVLVVVAIAGRHTFASSSTRSISRPCRQVVPTGLRK